METVYEVLDPETTITFDGSEPGKKTCFQEFHLEENMWEVLEYQENCSTLQKPYQKFQIQTQMQTWFQT